MADGAGFAGERGAFAAGDESEKKEEGQLEGECSGGVEEDVEDAAGAVGKEGLVQFIGAGDEGGGGDGEGVAGEGEMQAVSEFSELVTEGEGEGAKADEGECSVAEEVSGFAEEVVELAPVMVDGGAEKGLAEAVEGGGGAICAKGGGGFEGEDAGGEEDGKPCAEEGEFARRQWQCEVRKDSGGRSGHGMILGSWRAE